MVIVVNTGVFGVSDIYEAGIYLHEVFSKIAESNTECRFVLIYGKSYDKKFILSSNVKVMPVKQPPGNFLLKRIWYNYKIPSILKKENADVFVSFDGLCSLRTKLPQCVVVSELSFLHSPSSLKRAQLLFYRKYTPASLNIAKTIVATSFFFKNEIIKTYSFSGDKTDVVYSAAREIFLPVCADEKKIVKEKHTGAREYFFYTGGAQLQDNLLNLLKAFSLFKKRQQTGMKLVLAVSGGAEIVLLSKILETYKYRSDVVLIENPGDREKAMLTGAAYSVIFPSLPAGLTMPMQEGIQCHVPVIAPSNTALQEIVKNSVLYFNPEDINDLAEKMMLIYRDESLRQKLVENTRATSGLYSCEKTAALLWNSILKACNK